MVYGSLADVKQRLDIKTNTHDTQLGDNLTDANAYVDNELSPYVTTPISAPQVVIEAENSIAAGFFIEEKQKNVDPRRTEEAYLTKRGKEKLAGYIESTYKPGKSAKRQTTGFAVMTSKNSWDP